MTVDSDEYVVFDDNAYTAIETNIASIQGIYKTSDLINRGISCYINIDFVTKGEELSVVENLDEYVWKGLILFSLLLFLCLVFERIYFYTHGQKKYETMFDDTYSGYGDFSLVINLHCNIFCCMFVWLVLDELEPMQLASLDEQLIAQERCRTSVSMQSKQTVGNQPKIMRVNTNSSMMSMTPQSNKNRRSSSSYYIPGQPHLLQSRSFDYYGNGTAGGRAMSVQINNYPFDKPLNKQQFKVRRNSLSVQQKRRNSIANLIQRRRMSLISRSQSHASREMIDANAAEMKSLTSYEPSVSPLASAVHVSSPLSSIRGLSHFLLFLYIIVYFFYKDTKSQFYANKHAISPMYSSLNIPHVHYYANTHKVHAKMKRIIFLFLGFFVSYLNVCGFR